MHVSGQSLYYQVGDIVSVMDEDGDIYYAQLRGFMQDQYMNKSAVITWLLPTTESPPEGFDSSTFILGKFFYRKMHRLPPPLRINKFSSL